MKSKGKGKGKPFGIMVVVEESPMGEAYRKAVGAKQPKPEDSDPKMLAPKGEKDKGPKSKMPVAPKGEKPATKPRRSGKQL
jgi:hypothetical protein